MWYCLGSGHKLLSAPTVFAVCGIDIRYHCFCFKSTYVSIIFTFSVTEEPGTDGKFGVDAT